MFICGTFHAVFFLCLAFTFCPSLPFSSLYFFDSQLWVIETLARETVDKQDDHSIDIIFFAALMLTSHLESAGPFWSRLHGSAYIPLDLAWKQEGQMLLWARETNLGSATYQLQIPGKLSNFPVLGPSSTDYYNKHGSRTPVEDREALLWKWQSVWFEGA